MDRDPLQRCRHYVPGLRSRPWWPAQDVPEAAALESRSVDIAREFADLVLCGRLRLHPESLGGPRKPLTDGDWNMFELWTHERPNLGNLVEAPVTADVVSALRGAGASPRGNVFFSVLQPGVHVRAHCGPTNTRIRLHLGIQIPLGASMRVGTDTRTWEEGKCLVFDDAWEHEANNPSDRPRSVLLVDVWHPDLDADQREVLGRRSQAQAAEGAERAWERRRGGAPVACEHPDPIDPRIFSALGPQQRASIVRSARKARSLDLPFIAAASRRVLNALAVESDDDPPGGARPEIPITDEVIWNELAALASEAGDHGLREPELIDLAQVCSVSWRTWHSRSEAMAAFLKRWLPAEKAALADRLSALGSVGRRFSALADCDSPAGRPPFGALVPVLCAACRRSLISARLDG